MLIRKLTDDMMEDQLMPELARTLASQRQVDTPERPQQSTHNTAHHTTG